LERHRSGLQRRDVKKVGDSFASTRGSLFGHTGQAPRRLQASTFLDSDARL
jgi:hypothetical protein